MSIISAKVRASVIFNLHFICPKAPSTTFVVCPATINDSYTYSFHPTIDLQARYITINRFLFWPAQFLACLRKRLSRRVECHGETHSSMQWCSMGTKVLAVFSLGQFPSGSSETNVDPILLLWTPNMSNLRQVTKYSCPGCLMSCGSSTFFSKSNTMCCNFPSFNPLTNVNPAGYLSCSHCASSLCLFTRSERRA